MNFDSEVDAAQAANFFDEDVSDFLRGSELDFDDEQHLLFDGYKYFTGLGRQIIIDDVIENYPSSDDENFRKEWIRMTSTTSARLIGNAWEGGMRKGRGPSIHQIPILFEEEPEKWLSEEKQRAKGYIEEYYLDRQWNKLRFIYVFFQLYITKFMPVLIISHNRADDDTGSIVYDILYEFRLLIDRISYWNYFPWEVLLLTDTIDSILLAMNNVNNKIGMMRTATARLPQNYAKTDPDFHLLSQMAFAGEHNYFTFQILQSYYFYGSVTDRYYRTLPHGVNVANRMDLTRICQQLARIQGVPYFPMVDEHNPQNLLLTDQPGALRLIDPNSPLNTQSLLTQSVFQIMFSSNGIPLTDLMTGLQRLRSEPPDLLYSFFLTMMSPPRQNVLFLHRVAEGEVWRFSNYLLPPPSEASDSSEDGDGTPQAAAQEFSQPSQPIAPHDQTPQSSGTGRGQGASSSRPTVRLSPAQNQTVQNILLRLGSSQDRIESWMVNPQKTILMVEKRPAIQGGLTENYWIDLKTLLVYNNPEMKQPVDNVSGEGVRRGLFGGKRKKKTRRRKRRKRKKTRIKNKKKRRKKTRRRR